MQGQGQKQNKRGAEPITYYGYIVSNGLGGYLDKAARSWCYALSIGDCFVHPHWRKDALILSMGRNSHLRNSILNDTITFQGAFVKGPDYNPCYSGELLVFNFASCIDDDYDDDYMETSTQSGVFRSQITYLLGEKTPQELDEVMKSVSKSTILFRSDNNRTETIKDFEVYCWYFGLSQKLFGLLNDQVTFLLHANLNVEELLRLVKLLNLEKFLPGLPATQGEESIIEIITYELNPAATLQAIKPNILAAPNLFSLS